MSDPVGEVFTKTVQVRRKVFQCADCGALQYARRDTARNAEGLTICPACARRQPRYWRCSRCWTVYEWAEGRAPRPKYSSHPDHPWPTWCADCAVAPKGRPRKRPCERCGDDFTPASHSALYCSTRCRVAAHRARQASEG